MDYHLGLRLPYLSDYLVDRAGDLAGFYPDEARPIDYCKNIHQPVLMVHGDKDQRIDISYGRANFDNLASSDKRFLSIEGANHLNVWQVGR